MRCMRRLGILAGTFNPPTIAHVELALAARAHVDEVIWALPRQLPHKEYHGATLEERVEMIERIGARVAMPAGGLFMDIVRELRQSGDRIYFICGRDAAERIVTWDYGASGAVERMLEQFELLVAERAGSYRAPEHLRSRVHAMEVASDLGHISSTEVRERAARGERWEHLVPEPIVENVREIYSCRRNHPSSRFVW